MGFAEGEVGCGGWGADGVEGADEEVGVEGAVDAASAAGSHGRGVEDGCGVAAVEEGVKTLDDGFKKAVDAIGARNL